MRKPIETKYGIIGSAKFTEEPSKELMNAISEMCEIAYISEIDILKAKGMRELTEYDIEIRKVLMEEASMAMENPYKKHTKKFRKCNNAKRAKPRRKK